MPCAYSWLQMMLGNVLTASSCSKAWFRWVCGHSQTSSSSTSSASGRWVNDETSSPLLCASLSQPWTWHPTWSRGATAPVCLPHGNIKGPKQTNILRTSCMTCTLCVTIMEACMEVTTQVCGLMMNKLGLNQYGVYMMNCWITLLFESVCVFWQIGVVVIDFRVCQQAKEYTWAHSAVNLRISVVSAYCRNSVDGQWYSYDDSSVEPVPEGEVCTRGAYILFYQRRNSIPAWSASCSLRGQISSPSLYCRKIRSFELIAPVFGTFQVGTLTNRSLIM